MDMLPPPAHNQHLAKPWTELVGLTTSGAGYRHDLLNCSEGQ